MIGMGAKSITIVRAEHEIFLEGLRISLDFQSGQIVLRPRSDTRTAVFCPSVLSSSILLPLIILRVE
jgi:hypothetical protein